MKARFISVALISSTAVLFAEQPLQSEIELTLSPSTAKEFSVLSDSDMIDDRLLRLPTNKPATYKDPFGKPYERRAFIVYEEASPSLRKILDAPGAGYRQIRERSGQTEKQAQQGAAANP